MNTAINFADKLGLFSEHWSPKVIAEMNNYQFKVVKLKGEFVWHSHDDTDETFIVLQGTMKVHYRDRVVEIGKGEMLVIPRGIEHMTSASLECHALIIEPRNVINTGDTGGELTAENDVWI